MTKLRTALLTLSAVALAACGGGSDSSQSLPARTARGAISAAAADGSSITVNGIQLSVPPGATVKVDDNPSARDLLENGMVVTVKGNFDDRGGTATEIEYEHQLEGRVDDKGTDFVTIGGTRVQVDDTVHYDNSLGSLAGIAFGPSGSVVAVSGVPADDKGGLRASRIDLSPRNGGNASDDDDIDVKGFVSDLDPGVSLRLKLTPEATSYYSVDIAGAVADGAYGNGSYVEVRANVPAGPGGGDVIGTIVASTIHVEDRFGQAEFEVEGYVTSVVGNTFHVDGVQVETSTATRYEFGTDADLVPGTKVEAEGSLGANGVLQARKVSFRPGVRITAVLEGTAGNFTMLGIPVQIPSHADDRVGVAAGNKVEVRAMPNASGDGIVALRIDPDNSGDDRVFLRAIATAKSASASNPTFTVFGFTVTSTSYEDLNGNPISASAFHALVEPGRTVIQARAASAANVDFGAKTWNGNELEIED